MLVLAKVVIKNVKGVNFMSMRIEVGKEYKEVNNILLTEDIIIVEFINDMINSVVRDISEEVNVIVYLDDEVHLVSINQRNAYETFLSIIGENNLLRVNNFMLIMKDLSLLFKR